MNKQDLFDFLAQDYDVTLLDSDMDLIIDICNRITDKENEQYKRTVKLKKGQHVVMHTCAEASSYNGKIWKTSSDSYDNTRREVVFLEGFSGSFSTDYLAVVDHDEKSLKEVVEAIHKDGYGASAKAIVTNLFDLPKKQFDHPYDCGDFARCYNIVNAVPFLKENIHKMAKVSHTWQVIISRWECLRKLHIGGETKGLNLLINSLIHNSRQELSCEQRRIQKDL